MSAGSPAKEGSLPCFSKMPNHLQDPYPGGGLPKDDNIQGGLDRWHIAQLYAQNVGECGLVVGQAKRGKYALYR